MATVTAYTKEKMDEIVAGTIVDASLDAGYLILTKADETAINLGSVMGPKGDPGPSFVVCTSDTRPTGGARYQGVAIYETDSTLVYVWTGTAWVYRGGMIICTSTTRPPMPIEGLEIYETDTDKRLIYNGVRWDLPWSTGWGDVGNTLVDTAQTDANITEHVITAAATPIIAVANRKYRISVSGWWRSSHTTGNNALTLRIKDGTAPLYSCISQLPSNPVDQPVNINIDMVGLTAGPHTINVTQQASAVGITAAAASANGPITIKVTDIGPNGAPV